MATEHRGDRWFAYHHATRGEHDQHWKERTSVGWYCMSLSRANTAADPCFAAVWIWPENRLAKQTQTHLDDDRIGKHLKGLPDGTIPTIITACGSTLESPEFTVVSEKGSGAFLVKHDMTRERLMDQCETSRADGLILRWAMAYPRSSNMSYAAIWVANPRRVAWKCTDLMEVKEFQKEFDANAQGWIRPSVFMPTLESPSNPSQRRFMAGWSDALVHSSVSFLDINDATLIDLIKKHKKEGLLPIHIQSFGIGSDMRYGLIIGSPEDVIDIGTLVFDGHPPPLPTPTTRYLGVVRKFQRHPDSYSGSSKITTVLDAAVKKDMENTGHRAAALALARNGDLVFAAGYTYAEEGLYPQTSPTDVFRVGSLSKVITAIAIHQLAEKKKSLLDEKVASLLELKFKAPFGKDITVQDLLEHRGGIPKNAGVIKDEKGKILDDKDQMEYDRFVNDGEFPVDKDMVFKFVAGMENFVSTKPGTTSVYSNTGYDFLGDVVRKRSPGGSLIEHVRNEIFQRVGIQLDDGSSKAPRWAESERLGDQNGEVRYHDSSLKTTITVASDSGELVPSCYGVWNMARIRGCGAWVMAAPHYLRILSRFTLPGAFNPLFDDAATVSELATPKKPNTWGLGVSGNILWKNGAAPGARALCLFKPGGWSMVYLTNSDEGDNPKAITSDIAGFQGWLDSSWDSIKTDPTAWSKVYVKI